MEPTAFDDAQQVLQLLDIARSVVGKIREAQWWRMQPAEMLEVGCRLQELSNEVYAAHVNVAGELDSERIGEKFGCTSTAALLRQTLNISPAEANGRVNAARKVVPRESESAGVLPAVLPRLAGAMAAGQVNSEHVKLVVTTMTKLPSMLPVEDVDFWEAFLIDKARLLDPSAFEKVCRSILDKADPDGSLDESTAAAKMEFSFGNRNLRTGLTPVKGQLDDYSVEVIKKAIDALAAPRPGTGTRVGDGDAGGGTGSGTGVSADGETDDRPGAAGRGDDATGAGADTGLVADGSASTGVDAGPGADSPGSTGAGPSVDADAVGGSDTVTDSATMTGSGTQARSDAHSSTFPDAPSASHAGDVSDAGVGFDCGAVVRDQRSAANRRAHALVAALRGFLDAGAGPTQGGERPHITMVMNWDVVKGAVAEAGYDSGGSISAAQARKFLCDAEIIPAILGSKSEVLDIGRKSRTFPVGMRRAITLRDGGCVWPGCDRPPGWCDCHHVEFWHRDHGDTCYKFGVLLCPHHHTEIHKNEWVIQMADDGKPELIPPKWMDSEQKPRRNNMHRPMEM